MAKKVSGKKGYRKKSKSKMNRTNMIIVTTIGIACIGMVIAMNVINNKSKGTNGTGEISPALEITKAPEKPSVTPKVTDKVEITLPPEPTTAVSPTVVEAKKISEKEALKLVKDAIVESKYSIELISEKLSIDGKEYYEYHVLLDNKVIEPSILVLKEDGSLYYYDQAGIVSGFTKFPLDKVETAGSKDNTITDKEAVEIAKNYSRAALGLEKELKDYTIEVDNWTTIVKGESCYCLNVFDMIGESKQLVGVYYVSVDGNHVYWLNEEEQEFVEIRE